MSSSKRDDEPSDLEVGMTTAERRRRRRRGGGLRVPSDNVPRRAATAPPVVAPVPEDPALAMSIAYSFTNDGSEPVPRVDLPAASKPAMPVQAKTVIPSDAEPDEPDEPEELEADADESDDATEFAAPQAPEAASTMIDPPAPLDEAPQEFEMKTREMSSVDLESLGLSELVPREPRESGSRGSISVPPPLSPEMAARKSSPRIQPPAPVVPAPIRAASDVSEIDVDVDAVETPNPDGPSRMKAPMTLDGEDLQPQRRERVKTVALSEDDLEEVREVVRSMTSGDRAKTVEVTPVTAAPVSAGPTVVAVPVTPNEAVATSEAEPEAKKPTRRSDEIMSVPDIDIQVLSERVDAGDSGDIEVDVDMARETTPPPGPPPGPPPPKLDLRSSSEIPRERASTVPPVPPPTPSDRTRAPSVPPLIQTGPIAKQDKPDHPPPPPPGAAHHAPPPPPPKVPPAAIVAKVKPNTGTPPQPQKEKPRGKPWFVDLFDEDYLRTLPFLTPQATQAEAEFVIEAMGLQPGAQVLDLGCGYGRHAMELAARGFHMVGLDLSTPLLVRGGEEAHRRGLTINFVRGDMRELDFDAQFDGAYCLFSTFGYFDDETNKKTVSNLARALKPGGRVMIEILNRDYVIADLPTRIWWEGEGCVVLEEVELNYFSSRIQVNRSVVFDDGRQLEQEISVRAYSLHEVGKLMHAAGFRVLEVSGGYQTRGRFFGNQSRHIIVLAERKDGPTS